jgi:hypothetical protein
MDRPMLTDAEVLAQKVAVPGARLSARDAACVLSVPAFR